MGSARPWRAGNHALPRAGRHTRSRTDLQQRRAQTISNEFVTSNFSCLHGVVPIPAPGMRVPLRQTPPAVHEPFISKRGRKTHE